MNLHALWANARLYLVPSTSRRIAALLRRNRNQRRLIRALQRETHELVLARRTLTRISLSYQQMRAQAEAERDAVMGVLADVKAWRDNNLYDELRGPEADLAEAFDAWDRQREVSPR